MIHLLAAKSADKVTLKCGLSFNPQRKTGHLEWTGWDDGRITCPDCKEKK